MTDDSPTPNVSASDVRSREHISIYTLHGEPLFFQHFDGPFFPTLRLLHKCASSSSLHSTLALRSRPTTGEMSAARLEAIWHERAADVDRGAIRFLLAGAHMMCPGFTSAGGSLPPPDQALPANTPVAIHAEGKEHAVGIGITKLGTEEIKSVNKGVGVETVTYLGDDLWKLLSL
ncbi:hypothetical protein GSI_13565 [Ganoderma sinense ZZ0214-1]|uniref:Translation machinery-associated protein 20 n=1 Tax=Ganoderma sinense ZZ0214-1 TaxID=1077348 RepID=A0A2G8RQM5_9APHY|nr:hypothetical protein GSI_13565 [Ganoderma sinense ZZ0214-1]